MEIKEVNKAFRISLQLKEGKSPHIYLTQLKEMMKDDTSLHPMMAKTLKLLKATRTPFIMVPRVKEVVIDPLNFRHFDRAAEPRGDWVVVLWSQEEVRQHIKDAIGHIKSILSFFEKLGYELFNYQECTSEYIASLEALTIKQIEAEKTRMAQVEGGNN